MNDRKPTPITLAIYRDLRVGMVIITLMLGVAILIEELTATCWQYAISAYYYTSAHSILIAALLALGTLLIMYKGSSDTEDVSLTLAGVSALMIAMVPQDRPKNLCGRNDLPPAFEPAVQPNVWAVVIALIVGWVVMAVLHWHNHTGHKRSPLGTLAVWIFWLIMALGFIALVFCPDWFNTKVHGIAGFLLLSSFIITVFCAAYVVGQEDIAKSPHRRCYQWCYGIIAVAMVLTLIGVVALHLKHPKWELWVLLIEGLVIIEFAVYWAVQTCELWNSPDRRKRLPDDVQRWLEEEGPRGGGFAGFRSELAGPHDARPGGWLLRLL